MRLALVIGLALAGCSQAPESGNTILANGPDGGTQTDPPPRYIGHWAANARLCKDGAWKFAELDLTTAGEVSCDFHRVRDVAGGYDADATCLAEGARSSETIRLRFTGDDAMRVESKSFPGTDLIRCPD